MTSRTRMLRRTLTPLGLLAAAVALVLASTSNTITTMASYVDQSYARSNSVPAAPVGLSGSMIDTGVGLSPSYDVYMWGYLNGGVGGGNSGSQVAPQRVPLPAGTIRQVTAGTYDANAVDVNGNVWGWGAYDTRNGTSASRGSGTAETPQRLRIGTPWNGSGALLSDIFLITSSRQAGAGIRADGTVWRWGTAASGGSSGDGAAQVPGLPDPSVAGNRPVFIKGANTNFSVILENGDVYAWGGNSSLPGTTTSATATRVTQLDGWMRGRVAAGQPYIVSIDGGNNIGGALLSNGQILTWGTGTTGRTGSSAPAVVPGLADIVNLQYSRFGMVALTSTGQLYGADGLGTGTNGLTQTFSLMDTNVRQGQVATGEGFYYWQRTDGTYWGRGYNSQGQLGLPAGSQTSNRAIAFGSLTPNNLQAVLG